MKLIEVWKWNIKSFSGQKSVQYKLINLVRNSYFSDWFSFLLLSVWMYLSSHLKSRSGHPTHRPWMIHDIHAHDHVRTSFTNASVHAPNTKMIDKFFYWFFQTLSLLLILFMLSNYQVLKVNQIEAIENDDHKIWLNLFRKSIFW